jgi:hypothetical protein
VPTCAMARSQRLAKHARMRAHTHMLQSNRSASPTGGPLCLQLHRPHYARADAATTTKPSCPPPFDVQTNARKNMLAA